MHTNWPKKATKAVAKARMEAEEELNRKLQEDDGRKSVFGLAKKEEH